MERHLSEHVENLARKTANPQTAFNTCKQIAFALNARFGLPVIQLAGYKGRTERMYKRWRDIPPAFWIHYVVEVDGQILDMTFSQFDDSKPVPYIYPKSQLTQLWQRVYEL